MGDRLVQLHRPTQPHARWLQNGKRQRLRDELRDKTHGRIYRVVYTKAKPEKLFALKDATPEKLVDTLKNPNMTWRLHAQRLLVERGKDDVVPALEKLIADKSVDEMGLNAGSVHAIWTLTALGKEIPESATTHPSPLVRQAAFAALGARGIADRHLGQHVGTALGVNPDPDARVRLAAMLAAADLPKNDEEEQHKLEQVLGWRLSQLGADTTVRLLCCPQQPERQVVFYVLAGRTQYLRRDLARLNF